MATEEQIETIAVARLEEICSWAFQASLRFGKKSYDSCIVALDNAIKVAKEAKDVIKGIHKTRNGKKMVFLKTIAKSGTKKPGLKGLAKPKRKTNGKSKVTRKRTAAGNKKKSRKV